MNCDLLQVELFSPVDDVLAVLVINVERSGGWGSPIGWWTLFFLEGIKQGVL